MEAQSAKFDALCEQYYQIPNVAVGKAAFKRFVQAVQAKSDLLDDFNNIILKIVNLQAEANEAKEVATRLQIVAG